MMPVRTGSVVVIDGFSSLRGMRWRVLRVWRHPVWELVRADVKRIERDGSLGGRLTLSIVNLARVPRPVRSPSRNDGGERAAGCATSDLP